MPNRQATSQNWSRFFLLACVCESVHIWNRCLKFEHDSSPNIHAQARTHTYAISGRQIQQNNKHTKADDGETHTCTEHAHTRTWYMCQTLCRIVSCRLCTIHQRENKPSNRFGFEYEWMDSAVWPHVCGYKPITADHRWMCTNTILYCTIRVHTYTIARTHTRTRAYTITLLLYCCTRILSKRKVSEWVWNSFDSYHAHVCLCHSHTHKHKYTWTWVSCRRDTNFHVSEWVSVCVYVWMLACFKQHVIVVLFECDREITVSNSHHADTHTRAHIIIRSNWNWRRCARPKIERIITVIYNIGIHVYTLHRLTLHTYKYKTRSVTSEQNIIIHILEFIFRLCTNEECKERNRTTTKKHQQRRRRRQQRQRQRQQRLWINILLKCKTKRKQNAHFYANEMNEYMFFPFYSKSDFAIFFIMVWVLLASLSPPLSRSHAVVLF